MANTTAFALRMPPEFKWAAKALTQTQFYEWSDTDPPRTVRSFGQWSVNGAILQLIQIGMGRTLEILEPELRQASAEHEAWYQIVAFFLSNPVADTAIAANFGNDTAARSFIEKHMKGNREYAARNSKVGAESPDDGTFGWERNGI